MMYLQQRGVPCPQNPINRKRSISDHKKVLSMPDSRVFHSYRYFIDSNTITVSQNGSLKWSIRLITIGVVAYITG